MNRGYRRGRGSSRGFKGNSSSDLPKRAYVPDPEDEECQLSFPEKFRWLQNDSSRPLGSRELSWKEGRRKISLEGETNFVSAEVLQEFLDSKYSLDGYQEWQLRHARKKSNPFEGVETGTFVNRSWLKMANMDSLFEGLFTSPLPRDCTHGLEEGQTLTFIDICGGPGGFVEYVLWRKRKQVKGYGITLKHAREDYKHLEFKNADPKFFETHYGVGCQRGDGDITNSDNIEEFVKFVRSKESEGVHFAMADGAWECEPEENHSKDIVFQRLIMCQLIIALQLIKPGGHYVTNMFDIITPFTVGLVFIMRRCFDSICIIKPVTSRPHNSERFIVCRGKSADTSTVVDYLVNLNSEMNRVYPGDPHSDSMIVEVVPLDQLLEDQEFCDYVRESNEKIIKAQIQYLKKLKIFVMNPELYDARYVNQPSLCVQIWNIPQKHANDQPIL